MVGILFSWYSWRELILKNGILGSLNNYGHWVTVFDAAFDEIHNQDI